MAIPVIVKAGAVGLFLWELARGKKEPAQTPAQPSPAPIVPTPAGTPAAPVVPPAPEPDPTPPPEDDSAQMDFEPLDLTGEPEHVSNTPAPTPTVPVPKPAATTTTAPKPTTTTAPKSPWPASTTPTDKPTLGYFWRITASRTSMASGYSAHYNAQRTLICVTDDTTKAPTGYGATAGTKARVIGVPIVLAGYITGIRWHSTVRSPVNFRFVL